MWRIILWVAYTIISVGAIVGYVVAKQIENKLPVLIDYDAAVSIMVLMLISQLAPIADLLIRKKRIEVISALYFGLLIGILLSYLIVLALEPVLEGFDEEYRPVVVLLTTLILPEDIKSFKHLIGRIIKFLIDKGFCNVPVYLYINVMINYF